MRQVAPPSVAPDAPLQLLVTNIDYDEHKGRVAIGRVTAGTVRKAQSVRATGGAAARCVLSLLLLVLLPQTSGGDYCRAHILSSDTTPSLTMTHQTHAIQHHSM